MTLPLFIALAAAMTVAACVLVVWPLLRGRDDAAPVAAVITVAVVPASALIFYATFSNWPWQGTPPEAPQQAATPSVEEMVVRLESRLQAQPEDGEGWLMLGRSYVVLGRYREAVDAYGRARELSGDTDVAAITGYAEALAMQAGGVIGEESALLFEQVLGLAPHDRKALWYGGLAAFERGEARTARERWQRLLAFDPPEAMASVLREQIAMADAALGEPPADLRPDTQSATSRQLRVQVVLDASLADRVPSDAPLFILARPVGGGGPPLAVVRASAADLPLQLVLSDDDAMIPGRNLSAHEEVEIVARIALGGAPTAQPGDLYGSRVTDDEDAIAIAIDKVF